MALINCSECGHEISSKAVTCPHCGCPTNVQPTNIDGNIGVEKKEIFKVANSSFVLSEIVSISEFGWRKWLVTIHIVITLALMGIISKEALKSEYPNFLCGVVMAVLLISFIILYFLLLKSREVSTTGDSINFSGSYEQISDEYLERVPASSIVEYEGKNPIRTMNFIINTDRVANFNYSYDLGLFWLLIIASLILGSVAAFIHSSSQTNAYILAGITCVTIIIGIMSIRTNINIVGVGGKSISLYTTLKDSSRIQKELESKIKNLTR